MGTENHLTSRPKRVPEELLEESSGMLHMTYPGEDCNKSLLQLIDHLSEDATNAVLMAARYLMMAIAYKHDRQKSYVELADKIEDTLGWANWKKLYNLDNLPPGYRIVMIAPGAIITAPRGVSEYPERVEALKKAAYNVLHPEEPLGFTPLEEVHLKSWYQSFFSEDQGGIPVENGGYKAKIDRDPEPITADEADEFSAVDFE